MSPEHSEVYLMREADEDGWVRPTPALTAIVEAVTAATDLEATDLESPEHYVDRDAVRALLDGEGGDELIATVEGHRVILHADGTIDVSG